MEEIRYIACGFYTNDYERWLPPLLRGLDQFGIPHDFVLAAKRGADWETNTMGKPIHILNAMDRHPGKVIVWLDVDCTVHGSLAPLADIRADVAFRMFSKLRRRRRGANFRAQSGTMVFRPTEQARRFVTNWATACETAPYGEIDQSAQILALPRSIGTTFEPLPLIYCVNPDERSKVSGAIVLHDSAATPMSSLSRHLGRVFPMARRNGVRAG